MGRGPWTRRLNLIQVKSLQTTEKEKKKENFELYSQKKNTELVCLTRMKMETEYKTKGKKNVMAKSSAASPACIN